MKTKAILFDFDGTLADTLPVCFSSFEGVFRDFDNREVTREEIKSMFGPSETGIIRENLKSQNAEKAIERYYQIYQERHKDLVESNDEMTSLIKQLKNDGYKLGIVTGKARRSLDISLECLELSNHFDVIITGDDVEKPKPHPEGIFKAIDYLKLEKSEVIFLGDSDADISAGKQAGVYTIGVQWLPNFQTEEFSVQPDAFFKRLEELNAFLQSHNF